MKFNFKKLSLAIVFTIALFSLVFVSCSSSTTKEDKPAASKETTLRVFAAASLKESLNEIKADFESKENAKLEYNLAASGTLANQIVESDVADVFISASKSHMKIVSDKDLAENETDLFKNDLVLIAPKDSTKVNSIADIAKVKNIAIGETKSVPVGKYSQEALTNLKLWDSLEKDKKIMLGKDVKAVLTYVETGEVDAGIVYKSDAVTSDKVKVVATFDAKDHSPIVYPAAIIKNSPSKDLAKKFLDYVKANADKFEKNGFQVIK